MVALDERALIQLENVAQSFDRNHLSFVAEAENIVRARQDAGAALFLLSSLRNSPYASRIQPKLALNDVGQWLEHRLFSDLLTTPEALLRELGWLRRFAFIAGNRPGATAGKEKEGGASEQKIVWAFGDRLEEFEEKRTRARRDSQKKKPEEPKEEPIPRIVEVAFQDVNAFIETRGTVNKRLKKKKAPKDRVLELRVVDSALAARLPKLSASVTQTEGLLEIIQLSTDSGGKLVQMFADLPELEKDASSAPFLVLQLYTERPA